MQIWTNLILTLQILSALAMIGLVLLQQGKGADMGASFGSGASGSLFGATGSANFLSRSTAVAAAVFFLCTLTLAYTGSTGQRSGGGSVLDKPAAASAAAGAASGAAAGAGAIPTGAAPAAAASAGATPSTPAAPASSAAGAIPTGVAPAVAATAAAAVKAAASAVGSAAGSVAGSAASAALAPAAAASK